ncbi:MAG TPA: hypothetical protein VKY74_20390 [Chloroflexia bacterium]|nr:hypothetical protein [Chloroflexia bacterium]
MSIIKRYKRFLLWGSFGVFVCLLLAVVLSGVLTGTHTAVADVDPPDSAFMDTPIVDPTQEVSAMATKIATMKQLEEKQSITTADWLAGDRTKTNSGAPSPATEAEPAFPTGIFNDDVVSLDPGWPQYYAIKNRWQGVINGNGYVVYAGFKHDSPLSDVYDVTPLQGELVEMVIPADSTLVPYQKEFLTSTRSGTLHITAARGTCLSLTSADNTSYQFDVASGAWSCVVTSP